MKLFFATDIHGSETCWLKFLNSGAHYPAAEWGGFKHVYRNDAPAPVGWFARASSEVTA
jgi:hypothetical protein